MRKEAEVHTEGIFAAVRDVVLLAWKSARTENEDENMQPRIYLCVIC